MCIDNIDKIEYDLYESEFNEVNENCEVCERQRAVFYYDDNMVISDAIINEGGGDITVFSFFASEYAEELRDDMLKNNYDRTILNDAQVICLDHYIIAFNKLDKNKL